MNMTEIGELDGKIHTNKLIFGQIHPYFGQVQWLMFVGVFLRSSSNLKVHRCKDFLVKI